MFFRMPEKISFEEGVAFNYWAVVLKLLSLGIPWDKIQDFSPAEVSVILGLNAAFDQRRVEQEAVQQRQGSSSTHFSHVRGM